MKGCKVGGCSNKHTAKGYCRKHWQHMYRHGRVLDKTYRSPNDICFKDGHAEIILRDKKLNEVGRTIVDTQDLLILMKYKWHLGDGYARTNAPGVKNLHQILEPTWEETDHENLKKLDNRRLNLREGTHAQNMQNSPVDRRNKTGFKGVRLHSVNSKGERFQARITVNYKEIYLGIYDTPEDAARIYDRAAIEYYGEFARVNFPEEALSRTLS